MLLWHPGQGASPEQGWLRRPAGVTAEGLLLQPGPLRDCGVWNITPMCPSFHTMKPVVYGCHLLWFGGGRMWTILQFKIQRKEWLLTPALERWGEQDFITKFNSVMVLTGPKRFSWKTEPWEMEFERKQSWCLPGGVSLPWLHTGITQSPKMQVLPGCCHPNKRFYYFRQWCLWLYHPERTQLRLILSDTSNL